MTDLHQSDSASLKPPWGTLTAEQERYIVRVEAALEDFKDGRMTCEQLRSYLRRTSA